MRAAAAAAVAVALAGCFNPDLGETPFKCGPSNDCPPGYTCAADMLCHRNGSVDAPISTMVDAPAADARRPDARIIPLDGGVTCQPNTFQRCQDVTTALFCDGSGANLVAVGCEAGCDMSHMQCNHCQPGTTLCSGDDLISCSSDGNVTGTQHCVAGCDLGITPNACFVVAPPGFTDACRSAGGPDFTASGDMVVDTDACSGGNKTSQDVGPDLCIFKFANVLVPAGTTVRWSGARVPVVIATGTAEVAGRLFVNGHAATAGPGASGFNMGGGASSSDADGAGGGGHATKGGDGGPMMGADHVVPAGGSAYSADTINLLPGGNGGAGGSAAGGGGGGALGLIACGVLTLDATAVIDAGGGGGPGGALVVSVAGGSGGGAGGTIRIDAARVAYTSGAAIVANGGGGGGGNGVSASSGGTPGDDGHLDGTPAKGSAGAAGGGTGGNGGTSDGVTGALPAPGAPNTLATGGAGGGGGAAGVIVINARGAAAMGIPTGVIVSPAPKLGEVGRGH